MCTAIGFVGFLEHSLNGYLPIIAPKGPLIFASVFVFTKLQALVQFSIEREESEKEEELKKEKGQSKNTNKS